MALESVNIDHCYLSLRSHANNKDRNSKSRLRIKKRRILLQVKSSFN
jgi:hypothetical protein